MNMKISLKLLSEPKNRILIIDVWLTYQTGQKLMDLINDMLNIRYITTITDDKYKNDIKLVEYVSI